MVLGSISSAALPSHKTRWTTEEDERLREALVSFFLFLSKQQQTFDNVAQEKHGYGNWKAISQDLGTRNPLQCKNHARHWMLSDRVRIKIGPYFCQYHLIVVCCSLMGLPNHQKEHKGQNSNLIYCALRMTIMMTMK